MHKMYNDLYLDTRQRLLDAGVTSATLEARALVAAMAGKSVEDFIAGLQYYATDELCDRVESALARRLSGEPVAYIIGEWDFYGITLEVTPDVLVPRIDTEVLADAAIKHLVGAGDETRVLDMCCGSGCVGIAVTLNTQRCKVTFADVSGSALAIAKRNLQKHRLLATCVQADAHRPPPAYLGCFDLIICNPPYITGDEMKALDKSVSEFEPHLALHGGEDGLDFYRSVSRQWKSAIKPQGTLMFECGCGQADEVRRIMSGEGFIDIRLLKDTMQIDRVVVGRLS